MDSTEDVVKTFDLVYDEKENYYASAGNILS